MLNAKADVESKNSDGQTLLSWAAQNGHETMVMLPLNANANIESKDGDGWTPPWQAAWKGHKAIFKLLLEAKPDVESKEWRWLDAAAAKRGDEGVVKLLLDTGKVK